LLKKAVASGWWLETGETRAKDYRRDAESAEKGEKINTEDTKKSGEH
jgi:hypothetical protein